MKRQSSSIEDVKSDERNAIDKTTRAASKKIRCNNTVKGAAAAATGATDECFVKITPLNINRSTIAVDHVSDKGFESNHASDNGSGDDESESSEDDVEMKNDERAEERRGESLAYRQDETQTDDDFKRTSFRSAHNSTSIYKTIKDTENELDTMVLDVNKINELSHCEMYMRIYTNLLPIFVKSRLLLVDLISIPAEFAATIVKGQGVCRFFTFENLRVFNLDNATLLLDHRYKKTDERYHDFIVKVAGRPITTALASFPKKLTTETNVFAGSREVSVPTRHFVRSYIMRQRFSLKALATPRDSDTIVQHQFSEGVPASFWWNLYDAGIPKMGDFSLKLYKAVQDRPIIVDFLFLLGNVDSDTNRIQYPQNRAKWEPANNADPTDRAAITIHTMLCFGFRILSFGMLCEYMKDNRDIGPTGMDDSGDRQQRLAYAYRRRRQMNNFNYTDTSNSRIQKQAVMRMAYTLDSTESITNFFRIMDTYEAIMKQRLLRSRLFYKKTIKWDVIGCSYVYPNNSLYLVLGSCNMLYSNRAMSVCTASLSESMLNRLDDKPRYSFDSEGGDVKKRIEKQIPPQGKRDSQNERGRGETGATKDAAVKKRSGKAGGSASEKRVVPAESVTGPAKKRAIKSIKTDDASPVKFTKKRDKPLTLSPAPITVSSPIRGESFTSDK